jgi:hypothetical protein
MSTQMDRRIRKVEEVVATRQPKYRQVKIMVLPDNGDAADEARYRDEFERAIRDGCFVINLVSLKPEVPA